MTRLDEQTKARIRAEEAYRAQVRRETLRGDAGGAKPGRILALLMLGLVAALLLPGLGWYLGQPAAEATPTAPPVPTRTAQP